MIDTNELLSQILDWANDTKIMEDCTVEGQIERASALKNLVYGLQIGIESNSNSHIEDAIGKTAFLLTVLSEIEEFPIVEFTNLAYKAIANRRWNQVKKLSLRTQLKHIAETMKPGDKPIKVMTEREGIAYITRFCRSCEFSGYIEKYKKNTSWAVDGSHTFLGCDIVEVLYD